MDAVEREALRALADAASSGPWAAGTDTSGCYWDGAYVYAVDALPLPDYDPDAPDDEADKVAQWADAHEHGIIAQTHNYFSIPDAEHDANQRFIATARTAVPDLLDALDAAEERLARLVDIAAPALASLYESAANGGCIEAEMARHALEKVHAALGITLAPSAETVDG